MKRLFCFLFCFQAFFATVSAQPLTLDDCRRMALAYNRNLRNAALQQGAAQDNLQAYKTNRLPKFSLTGDYLYSAGKTSFTLPGGYLPTFIPNPATGALEPNLLATNPDGTLLFKEYAYMPDTKFDFRIGSVYSAGLAARQPLYMGGKIQASVRMARIATTLASLYTEKTEAEVLVGVDEAFFNCIKVEELVRSAAKYKEVLAEFHRQMEDAFQAGMKSKNDLLKVQVKLNEAELKLRQARNGLRLARMNLCYHIGWPMDTEIISLRDDFEETDLLSVRSPGISSRPEYAMLQQQIELKKQNVALVRSDFLPQVAAVASYNYTHGVELNHSNLFSKPSFMGGISVNIPLFNWGEGRRKVSAAKREVEMAANRLEDMSRQMELEAMQALNEYDEAMLEVALTRKSLAQAEENRTESGNRYQVGMETLGDYLEAQALWQKAQSDLVEARSKQRMSYTRYLKATGRLKTEGRVSPAVF